MDTRALGGEFFTKGRNPCSRNENSNTIYSSDPAHGSDGAKVHSRPERKEATKRQLRSSTGINHVLGGQESVGSTELRYTLIWQKPLAFVESPVNFQNCSSLVNLQINLPDHLVKI